MTKDELIEALRDTPGEAKIYIWLDPDDDRCVGIESVDCHGNRRFNVYLNPKIPLMAVNPEEDEDEDEEAAP